MATLLYDLEEKKLSELCTDGFMLILQLRSTDQYGDSDLLKTKVTDMLEKISQDARIMGIPHEDAQMCKFALVAFIDETIIGSEWNEKEKWLSEPLQMSIFNSFNAGEEFFTRLEKLRQNVKDNIDVLEVYYLCLELGFKGKYLMHSPELIRGLINEMSQELRKFSDQPVKILSPNGIIHNEFSTAAKGKFPFWFVSLIIFLFCLCMYIVLSYLISADAEVLNENIKQLIT